MSAQHSADLTSFQQRKDKFQYKEWVLKTICCAAAPLPKSEDARLPARRARLGAKMRDCDNSGYQDDSLFKNGCEFKTFLKNKSYLQAHSFYFSTLLDMQIKCSKYVFA